jgi:iron complex outermembrane receptor protein
VLPVQRPDWTLNLSADYESQPLVRDVTFSARLDANWRSSVFMSNIPGIGSFGFGTWDTAGAAAARKAFAKANKVEGFWIANTRFGFNDIKIGATTLNVAGWVRNIFDEDSVSYSPGIVIAAPASYERARTYGINLNVKF